MNIFDFDDYKRFVVFKIKSLPRRGRGQYRKMAIFLSTSSVNVSQIFSGDRHLTVEQACDLTEFFGFPDLESQFFIALVEYARASSPKLKDRKWRHLLLLRERSQNLKESLRQERELSEETRAIFYSNWYYSGIRLLSSISEFQSPNSIAAKFNLSLTIVNRVLEFLVQSGLCVEDRGRFRMGPKSTHLESTSPLVTRHHMNWRVKGMEKMGDLTEEELFVTIPCSLSLAAMRKIRAEVVESVRRATQIIDAAPEETVACLNIDLFRF